MNGSNRGDSFTSLPSVHRRRNGRPQAKKPTAGRKDPRAFAWGRPRTLSYRSRTTNSLPYRQRRLCLRGQASRVPFAGRSPENNRMPEDQADVDLSHRNSHTAEHENDAETDTARTAGCDDPGRPWGNEGCHTLGQLKGGERGLNSRKHIATTGCAGCETPKLTYRGARVCVSAHARRGANRVWTQHTHHTGYSGRENGVSERLLFGLSSASVTPRNITGYHTNRITLLRGGAGV